jgi:hypothetical protein
MCLEETTSTATLKVYMQRSKKVWQRWPVEQVPLSVCDLSLWENILMFELRKRMADGTLPPAKDEFVDAFFAKHAPAVGQVVFQTAFQDGSPRKPGFFTMWRSPDGIAVKVTDNEIEQCWQYSAETFLDALKQVEKALQGGLSGNRSFATRTGRKKG